jgi:hypothetical protein
VRMVSRSDNGVNLYRASRKWRAGVHQGWEGILNNKCP